jgi:hypothetical protein
MEAKSGLCVSDYSELAARAEKLGSQTGLRVRHLHRHLTGRPLLVAEQTAGWRGATVSTRPMMWSIRPPDFQTCKKAWRQAGLGFTRLGLASARASRE